MSEIPTSWSWSTIGELAPYIQRGKSPKYTERSDLPVINQKCIRWNQLELQHLKFIHPEQFAAWDEARYIAPGDILWNSTGTGTVGRAYLVNETDCVPPKVVDSHVTIVRHGPGIDPRYLFNWIKGPAVQSKIEEMCDGTTNQIELSRSAIAATRIPLAPIAEQTRIANQLDKLLARVQACNDRIDAIPALLKRFRQAVLTAATTGDLTKDWRDSKPSAARAAAKEVRLRLNTRRDKHRAKTKFKEPVQPDLSHWRLDVPESWSVESVSAFAECLDHLRVPVTKDKRATAARLYPYFGANGQVDMVDDFLFDDELVLVTEDETFYGRIKPIAYRFSGRCWVNNHAHVLLAGDRVRADYLCFSLMHYDVLPWLTGTTGRAKLTQGSLNALPLGVPPQTEMEEIVRRVEALFKLADRIEARYTAARAQAQRLTPLLLAKAFRGELVQQDPQDEPASVRLQRIAAIQPAKGQASRGRPRIQPQRRSATPEIDPTDWASLPDGAWVAPADPDGQAATVWLIAVLRAWGGPMPEREARLAALLCQQPRLFTAVLPAAQATQWSRLVGDEARPLPTQVARFLPAINSHWGRAIKGMRARGDLVEASLGDDITWALGPGTASIETASWPDGRAGFVVAHLRAHGIVSVLPLLEPSALEFVDARAA